MGKVSKESTHPLERLCEPCSYHLGTGDPQWYLDDLFAGGRGEMLLKNRLWAFWRESDHSADVSFVEFAESTIEGDEVQVSHLFTSSGTTGCLRECRHTFWGPKADGYVFYMDFTHVRAALDFLQERFFSGE